MCVIVYIPTGKHPSKKRLVQCWKSNSDGAGLMFADNNRLYVHKGFLKLADFLTAYKELSTRFTRSNFVLHFRIGTSGQTDATNCHPFAVSQNLAIVHNGIFPIKIPDESPLSDTAIFTRDVLQVLPKDFLQVPALSFLVSEYIRNSHSKAVFLDNNGHATIIGETAGTWDKGIWYSNTTYKTPNYMLPAGKGYVFHYKATKQTTDTTNTTDTTSKIECEYCGSIPSIYCKDIDVWLCKDCKYTMVDWDNPESAWTEDKDGNPIPLLESDDEDTPSPY